MNYTVELLKDHVVLDESVTLPMTFDEALNATQTGKLHSGWLCANDFDSTLMGGGKDKFGVDFSSKTPQIKFNRVVQDPYFFLSSGSPLGVAEHEIEFQCAGTKQMFALEDCTLLEDDQLEILYSWKQLIQWQYVVEAYAYTGGEVQGKTGSFLLDIELFDENALPAAARLQT